MGLISPSDARARFVGVVLLVVIAFLHLLAVSGIVEQGAGYVTIAFFALVAACLLLVIALVRAPASMVRGFWVGGCLLAATALVAFLLSRSFGLPGLAEERGHWFDLVGLLACYCEIMLVALAGVACRELTLAGVVNRPPDFRLMMPLAPAVYIALALAIPAAALGNEATPDKPDKSLADALEASASNSPATATSPADPLLGSFELGIALLFCLLFIRWAQVGLRGRVAAY